MAGFESIKPEQVDVIFTFPNPFSLDEQLTCRFNLLEFIKDMVDMHKPYLVNNKAVFDAMGNVLLRRVAKYPEDKVYRRCISTVVDAEIERLQHHTKLILEGISDCKVSVHNKTIDSIDLDDDVDHNTFG